MAGVQGGAEVDRVQAADCGGPVGLGQDPDGRVQADQLDLVQDGREPGHGVGRMPGKRTE
jgi:hypothetical protein